MTEAAAEEAGADRLRLHLVEMECHAIVFYIQLLQKTTLELDIKKNCSVLEGMMALMNTHRKY